MNSNLVNVKPKAAPKITSAEFEGEVVAYAPKHTKGYYLNDTAAWLWKHCDGEHSVDELVAQMRQEFECGEADVRADVEKTLSELREAGLIEAEAEASAPG